MNQRAIVFFARSAICNHTRSRKYWESGVDRHGIPSSLSLPPLPTRSWRVCFCVRQVDAERDCCSDSQHGNIHGFSVIQHNTLGIEGPPAQCCRYCLGRCCLTRFTDVQLACDQQMQFVKCETNWLHAYPRLSPRNARADQKDRVIDFWVLCMGLFSIFSGGQRIRKGAAIRSLATICFPTFDRSPNRRLKFMLASIASKNTNFGVTARLSRQQAHFYPTTAIG